MKNKNKISFDAEDDDGGQYEPSESENEYTETEKKLLKKVRDRRSKKVHSAREILPFDESGDNDDDDDDQDEIAMNDSDIEDNDRGDGLPDEKAWGSKKRTFYSTDFVDKDYSSYNAEEEEMALQEEAEAKAIQLRLAKQMNEADFSLDTFVESSGGKKEKSLDVSKTILKSDLSNMSKREKLQLFKKDSPEFDGLVGDFLEHLETSEQLLEPFMKYIADTAHPSHPLIDFVKVHNSLILNYCTNIAFYLLLKSRRISIKSHPIVKRLVQMRQLLAQLQERYHETIKPEVEMVLERIQAGEEIDFSTTEAEPVKKPKKKLNILKRATESDAAESSEDDNEQARKKQKLQTDSESEEEPIAEDGEEEAPADGGNQKRGITYQIAKNKGLTPHRKKENRNPRVKHRNKYKKAITRRKGAVRTVHTEKKRYTGEMFGIKSTVRKGIKIK